MLLTLALLLTPPKTHAALDPLTGARVSLITTQTSIAAPFLPNLESKEAQVGTQIAYLKSKLKGRQDGAGYAGAFSGFGLGFNYSSALRGGFGWYLGALANQVGGRAKLDLGRELSLDAFFDGLGNPVLDATRVALPAPRAPRPSCPGALFSEDRKATSHPPG